MKYYILLVRDHELAKWDIQFGDYDRAHVLVESQYYVESGHRKKDVRVVTVATDSQDAIDASVAALNLK